MQETTSSCPVDENFDPLSESYLEDPYAYYARFRREDPLLGNWSTIGGRRKEYRKSRRTQGRRVRLSRLRSCG
jgi:hypothetical protein